MFHNARTLIGLSALFIMLSWFPYDVLARPVTRERNPTAMLERRARAKGSYAIMTPLGRFLDYDIKYKSYKIAFKFGDGKDLRSAAYSTHNPSFVYAHRKDGQFRSMGKWMEEEILRPIALEEESNKKMRVEVMGSSIAGRATEWYEIYLGTDLEDARKCKSQFLEILEQYGKDQDKDGKYVLTYDGLDADAYIEKVKGVVRQCASKGESIGYEPLWHGEGDLEKGTPQPKKKLMPLPLSPQTQKYREDRQLRTSSRLKEKNEKAKVPKLDFGHDHGLSDALAGGLNLHSEKTSAKDDEDPFLYPEPARRTTRKQRR